MSINREYKATLFSELFSEPERLRELYNALTDADYDEETPVEINTLENVFFNDLSNDVSFTIGGKYVVLLEHQSTINANMPLRCLMYIARIYEKITDERAIYQEKQLEVPTPEFIVLYNGVRPFPAEKTLRLSDAYISPDETQQKFGSLELTVKVLNINPGYNDELLRKNKALREYTAFVEHVRQNQRKGLPLGEAITEAVNWGKAHGILEDFLTEHGAEVNSMLMTEFNIDIAKEVWQQEAREDGYDEGYGEGYDEGVAKGYASARAESAAEMAKSAAEMAMLKEEIAKLKANSNK